MDGAFLRHWHDAPNSPTRNRVGREAEVLWGVMCTALEYDAVDINEHTDSFWRLVADRYLPYSFGPEMSSKTLLSATLRLASRLTAEWAASRVSRGNKEASVSVPALRSDHRRRCGCRTGTRGREDRAVPRRGLANRSSHVPGAASARPCLEWEAATSGRLTGCLTGAPRTRACEAIRRLNPYPAQHESRWDRLVHGSCVRAP
jgi:hypothetical protein